MLQDKITSKIENTILVNIKCFFLCPEYSKHLYDLSPDGYLNNNKYVEGNDILFLQEKYKLITYKDILEIFKKLINKNTKDKFNILLEDFIEALSIHAKDRDDSLEQKMIELFYNRSKNS